MFSTKFMRSALALLVSFGLCGAMAQTVAAQVQYKIVTGPERGTYIQIGQDLSKYVADPAGIELEVLASKGSAENVQRMRYEPGVKFALVQSDVYQAYVDMATSGILLFARGLEVQRRLGIAFAQREVHKRYVAVVHDRVDGEHGEIDLPLSADWPQRPRQKVDHEQGKPSLTRWRRLAYDATGRTSRLALEPVTGRSHQLRVHLLAIGHPIVGDRLYGRDDGAERLLLHACELRFTHPVDGRAIELRCEPPF